MSQAHETTTVYQYFAASGQLIYVGITNRGTKRLHEHADSKPWWTLATGCTLEHYPTRAEALEREAYLIRTYRPPYNFQHNPDRGLTDQERSERLRSARPAWGTSGSIKERRTRWYATPREVRASLPCVRCGQRPGATGPECLNCRQERGKGKPRPVKREGRRPQEVEQELLDVERSRPLLASERRLLNEVRRATTA